MIRRTFGNGMSSNQIELRIETFNIPSAQGYLEVSCIVFYNDHAESLILLTNRFAFQVYNGAQQLERIDAFSSLPFVIQSDYQSGLRVRFHSQNNDTTLYGFTASYYLASTYNQVFNSTLDFE